MKFLLGTALVVFSVSISASAQASLLCSASDVREASVNLAGFKDALDLGAIPKTTYLDHERVLFMAQFCNGAITKEAYCTAMVTNWKDQIALARDNLDRAARMTIFEKYVVGMSSLKTSCGALAD